MTDIQTNGPLTDVQMEALKFTFADHLRVKGELDDANDQIAEYRVRLAEAEAKFEALQGLCNLYESAAKTANVERDEVMQRHAKLAALLFLVCKTIDDAALKDFVKKPPEA